MRALKSLTYKELVGLRGQVDAALEKHHHKERRELVKLIATVRGLANATSRGAGGRALKGRKLKPKFRNPTNRSQTWAGRGYQPRWLRAELKRGKKLATFLIK